MNKVTYEVEYTDTFQGEANYSWVRRATIELPEGVNPVRVAKAALGLTGVRMRKTDFGDTVRLDEVGAHRVMFITVQY